MANHLPNSKRPVGRPSVQASPELVRALRNVGLSYRRIAQETGYSYGTVRRAYRKNSSRSKHGTSVLRAALDGYMGELTKIDQAIARIKRQIRHTSRPWLESSFRLR